MDNLFSGIPATHAEELVSILACSEQVRIERIVSCGQASPAGFWYDQPEQEWVIVLCGAAELLFDTGEHFSMQQGDHLLIPAHQKHRVEWTSPAETTIWLAVFFE